MLQRDPRPQPIGTMAFGAFGLKIFLLGLLNALALWAAVVLVWDQAWWLLTALVAGTLLIDVIFLVERAYPLRYLLPGFLFLAVMVMYPMGYTVWVSMNKYGTGHVLAKDQVIQQLESRWFLRQDGERFQFTAFRDPAGQFAMVLTDAQGQQLLAHDGAVRPLQPDDPLLVDSTGDGEIDTIAGINGAGPFARMAMGDLVRAASELQNLTFAYEDSQLRMRNVNQFAQYDRRYRYDSDEDILVSLATGMIYRPEAGRFVSEEGEALTPGFRTYVGAENFAKLITNPQVSRPFLRVFTWNVQWALISMVGTFIIGLLLAILLNDPLIRFRTFYRSLLILPYAFPAFISALIWRGFYNVELGLFNRWLEAAFGTTVPWLHDAFWAKTALIIFNLWLGFPYMMLICLGALQSINQELYEAAIMDGATVWQQFRTITMPLLLVAIGPLLVASFAFNFNNFVVIYLVTEGRPPIAGAQTPAGATDILISYTYRLAFETGTGADYGLASAVAILIFFLVGIITWANFRFTRALEEVRENA